MTNIILIGIDPGTKTGIAVKSLRTQLYKQVETFPIHRAMDLVNTYLADKSCEVYVFVEDARLRSWIPKETGREVLQGAGSIKRDCAIWEDFLTDKGASFKMVAPAQGRTKWNPQLWQAVTGWAGRTSNHARDAAMIVHGITPIFLTQLFSKKSK